MLLESVVNLTVADYHPMMSLDAGILEKIGKRIRQARTERKLSQEELAELSKLSSTYIGRLERGEKTPSIDTLVTLADSLQVSPVDFLIDLEGKMKPHHLKSRIQDARGFALNSRSDCW